MRTRNKKHKKTRKVRKVRKGGAAFHSNKKQRRENYDPDLTAFMALDNGDTQTQNSPKEITIGATNAQWDKYKRQLKMDGMTPEEIDFICKSYSYFCKLKTTDPGSYKLIRGYILEYEQGDPLSSTDYATLNAILKNLSVKDMKKLRYIPKVLSKLWEFTVAYPPDDVVADELHITLDDLVDRKLYLTDHEKMELFNLFSLTIHQQAIHLNNILNKNTAIDMFVGYRGVKGGNREEIMKINTPGQQHTFTSLLSISFREESARLFTDEIPVVISIQFEGVIPGICISCGVLDYPGECEILLGIGVTIKFISNDLVTVMGKTYDYRRFKYISSYKIHDTRLVRKNLMELPAMVKAQYKDDSDDRPNDLAEFKERRENYLSGLFGNLLTDGVRAIVQARKGRPFSALEEMPEGLVRSFTVHPSANRK